MNLIDVAPTVFEAMGIETPPDMQGPGSSRVESSASLGRKTCSRLSPSPFFTVMSMALSATATFQTVKCLTLVEQVVRSLVGLGMVVIFYLLGSILVAIAAYALSMAGGVTLAHFSEAYVTRIARPRHSGEVEPVALFSISGPMIMANFTSRKGPWVAVIVLGIVSSASSGGATTRRCVHPSPLLSNPHGFRQDTCSDGLQPLQQRTAGGSRYLLQRRLALDVYRICDVFATVLLAGMRRSSGLKS